MSEKRIMIDTWAWLALYNPNDQFHEAAVNVNNALLDEGHIFVTTNGILAETYTNLSRWASRRIAIEFGRQIQAIARTNALDIVHTTEADEDAAWIIFEKYDDIAKLSYTDCVTVAIMQRLTLTDIFTGDNHFAMFGFIPHF